MTAQPHRALTCYIGCAGPAAESKFSQVIKIHRVRRVLPKFVDESSPKVSR
jgi:hypothetical protein